MSASHLRPLVAFLLALPAFGQISYEVEVDTLAEAWNVEAEIANPEGTDLVFWIAR